MKLVGKQALVRDAFLFCCYTGLRFSDFTSLRDRHVNDGWIKKKMVKTGYVVEVPLERIFDGKAAAIVARYGSIEKLTRKLGGNATVNKILHELTDRLDLDFTATFHTSRHTFATLLSQDGVPMTAIQQMLGHRKLGTTEIYSERDRRTLESQLGRVKKRKKNLERSPNDVGTPL